MEHQPQTAKKPNPVTWIVIVVVVLLIAASVYYFLVQEEDTNTNASNSTVNIDNTNTTVNTNSALNENVNTSENRNTAAKDNVNDTSNINTNVAANINATTDANTNVIVNANVKTTSTEEMLDKTPPEITNITASDITMEGVTITWSTDESSMSIVEYGSTTKYELGTLSDTSMVAEHSISLTDLDKKTKYHFRVKSQDAEKNETVSKDYSFSTACFGYSLVETKSIGTPYANPVGIATDQDNFWLMFGTHNGMEHKLIYYDIDTNEVLESFDFYNLIEVLGTGVYGITWDGANVWISVSGDTNKLVKVDPDTGEILQTWSSPTTLGPSDLAWDESKIWVSSGTSEIYTVDPENGGSSLFLNRAARDSGIAIRGDEVWVGNLFDTNVSIYNSDTKVKQCTLKKVFSKKGKFCFYNGQLALLNSAGITLYSLEQL